MAQNSLSGPKMREVLRAAGIEAQQVIQRRNSGHYVAEFYAPRLETGVPPSKLWAEVIKERLPSSTIIDNHDTTAGWRPGQPVIWASVTFSVEENKSSRG